MITYQLEDEFAGTVFVKHLGESGDDLLNPIFDALDGSDPTALLNWFLIPAMRSVRLKQAFGRWGNTLTQSELSIIMGSRQLEKWTPLLIEGAVLPNTTIQETVDPEINY